MPETAEDRTGAAPTSMGWDDLPDSVRTAAVTLAAQAVSRVPADQLPTVIAPIARFTPAKRARRGAVPLARTLAHDAAFRALVAQYLPAPNGRADDDPAAAAARAFLLRMPDLADRLDAARGAAEVEQLRGRIAELTATVERLTAQLAQHSAGAASGAGPEQRRTETERLQAEVGKLRKRLRDQGTRHKEAEVAAAAALRNSEAERERLLAAVDQERAGAEAWHTRAQHEAQRAESALTAVARLRDEAGQQRADADRRLDLLLDTVQRAAAGLRREWRLTAHGDDPADTIARGLLDPDRAPARSADPAQLLTWLALPNAHVIIDGYNVTKTGYPELPLAEQRDRLIRSLGPVASRTGCEVTVVFDGAAVVASSGSTRWVRVIFSPPGVTADDVVRQLAAAEPAGRVVVVVSSDREVADGARGSGARTAGSDVLLAILA